MDRTESGKPASTNPAGNRPESPPFDVAPTGAGEVHDFEAQKRIHQQIRNDPDYDDWEYGTEPLPHEAWTARRSTTGTPPSTQERP